MWRADPAEEMLFDQEDLLVLRRHTVPPTFNADDRFGDMFTLYGYDVRPQDANVLVTLYWRAERPIDHDYHYFVHLVDAQGKGYSQQDGELVHGLLPATRLRAGTGGTRRRDDCGAQPGRLGKLSRRGWLVRPAKPPTADALERRRPCGVASLVQMRSSEMEPGLPQSLDAAGERLRASDCLQPPTGLKYGAPKRSACRIYPSVWVPACGYRGRWVPRATGTAVGWKIRAPR